MNTVHKCALGVALSASLLSMVGCAGMSQRDQNTAVGAGIGAVGAAAFEDANSSPSGFTLRADA